MRQPRAADMRQSSRRVRRWIRNAALFVSTALGLAMLILVLAWLILES